MEIPKSPPSRFGKSSGDEALPLQLQHLPSVLRSGERLQMSRRGRKTCAEKWGIWDGIFTMLMGLHGDLDWDFDGVLMGFCVSYLLH